MSSDSSSSVTSSVGRGRRQDIAPRVRAFIDASSKAARSVARNRQRLQATVGVLLASVIVGLVGWINQDFLRERYYWRLAMGPSVLTAEQLQKLAGNPGAEFTECRTG